MGRWDKRVYRTSRKTVSDYIAKRKLRTIAGKRARSEEEKKRREEADRKGWTVRI